jgi:hypothetical protein
MTTAEMIEVKAAVGQAVAYLESITDLLIQNGEQIQDLRLEETELSEDGKYWFITLGYDRPLPAHRDPLSILSGVGENRRYQREYRIFKIESDSGVVKSMKIREL